MSIVRAVANLVIQNLPPSAEAIRGVVKIIVLRDGRRIRLLVLWEGDLEENRGLNQALQWW